MGAFESLADKYPYQYFCNFESGYTGAGSAILAAPSVTVQAVEMSKPRVENVFFLGMVVRAKYKGHPIDLINVHLRPPLSLGNEAGGVCGNFKSYWSLAPEIHSKEIQHYVDMLRPHAIHLIAGDFNE